jgi:hypothetical protein
VFWNNFDYYKGAPFTLGNTQVGGVAYPAGVGILLYGGHNNTIQNNRVYGNWLTGVGGIQAVTLTKSPTLQTLVGNQVKNNTFGSGGSDLNGSDLYYDGDGSDNCFGPNTGVSSMIPAGGGTFAPCPFTGANAFDQQAQLTAFGWATNPDHEAAWVRHAHTAKAGYTPLEVWTKTRGDK